MLLEQEAKGKVTGWIYSTDMTRNVLMHEMTMKDGNEEDAKVYTTHKSHSVTHKKSTATY